MKITGIIKFVEIESGTWAIESADGRTYIPTNMPEQLKHIGLKVSITAVHSEKMSFFMSGELIDVIQFKTLYVE